MYINYSLNNQMVFVASIITTKLIKLNTLSCFTGEHRFGLNIRISINIKRRYRVEIQLVFCCYNILMTEH